MSYGEEMADNDLSEDPCCSLNPYESVFKLIKKYVESRPNDSTKIFNIVSEYFNIVPVQQRLISQSDENEESRRSGSISYNNLIFSPKFFPDLREGSLFSLLDKIIISVPSIINGSVFPKVFIRNYASYKLNYEEIKPLGKGAFGRVVHVRRKSDNQEFAIKKIKIENMHNRSECVDNSYLKEVSILAKLKHDHIARFYSSWYQYEEISDEIENGLVSYSNTEEYCNSSSPKSVEEDCDNFREINLAEKSSDSEELNDVPSSKSVKDYSAFSEVNQVENDSNSITFASTRGSSDQCNPKPQSRKSRVVSFYIKMELGKSSLQDWIEIRNKNESFSWTEKEMMRHFKIFKEILLAVEYIHSKNILHRDIKPANILLNKDDKILLADFGLATAIDKIKDSEKKMSENVGTSVYIAPEIAVGQYGKMVDIFSLGIILLELLQPFGTGHERNITINNLKESRKLDPGLSNGIWSYFANLVLNMTEKEPENRPTASKILQHKYFEMNQTGKTRIDKSGNDKTKTKISTQSMAASISVSLPSSNNDAEDLPDGDELPSCSSNRRGSIKYSQNYLRKVRLRRKCTRIKMKYFQNVEKISRLENIIDRFENRLKIVEARLGPNV